MDRLAFNAVASINEQRVSRQMFVTLRLSSCTHTSASSENDRSAAADMSRKVALLQFLRPSVTTKVPMLLLLNLRLLLKSVLMAVTQHAASAYRVLASRELARVS